MKTCRTFLAFFTLLLISCSLRGAEIYDLRCENLREPLAIDNTTPRFSWKIRSEDNGFEQSAYRIVVYTQMSDDTQEILWDSGKVPAPQSVLVPYGGTPLSPSSLQYWKVKIWDGKGRELDWSDRQMFGIGMLSWDEWQGDYIGMPDEKDEKISPVFRQTFNIENTDGNYLLNVNSLGYHEVYLNGQKVGKEVLAPAVSQLDKRSLAVTYDLGSYLKEGKNQIVLWLGEGWYKQNLWDRQAVHNGPLVRAQLNKIKDGKSETLLYTDGTWECARTGYFGLGIWWPHQFGGEIIDARIKPSDYVWEQATTYDVKRHKVTPQMCEPNVVQDVFFATSAFLDHEGCWIVDMGKTFTGWVEIKLHQPEGRELLFEYADHYDNPNEFSTELGHKDIFFCSGGEDKFCNKFNYHSFRYIRISNFEGQFYPDVTGYAISPSFDDISSFECSDKDMNDIHDMVKRTFAALTLGGYLTDCQHIERLGYGGDGNASAQSFQSMWGVYPLYNNWMQAWADDIKPDGGVGHVAPSSLGGGSGPYWCAFMVAGPWRTYVNYGDVNFIERYYPQMESFMGYVERYTTDGLLGRWPDTDYRGWFLGDWACPAGVDASDNESVMLVASCVASECYDMMEKTATVLGKADDAEKYRLKKEQTNKAIHARFYEPEENRYGTGSQIDMAYPLLVGAVPEDLAATVHAKQLSDIEDLWNGHLSAGLVGVTKVTEWATELREPQTMYSMLKKRDYPGYLYMLDNGATTTWEYWNGIRSRIHNCYNGVGSWFYQALGGINADYKEPGYRHAIIDLQIPDGITWANTSLDTPYGELSVRWRMEHNGMRMDLAIPVGSYATVVIPEGYSKAKIDQKKAKIKYGKFELENGVYAVTFQ